VTADATALRRRALGGPSARALLFTILGEYVLPRAGAVWTRTVVDALGALGVEEKAARQALARTAADGWLRAERAGRQVRWALTGAAEKLLREGAERIYSFGGAQRDWDGRWLLLLTNADGDRDVRHRLRTRLTWAGFGALRNGVWISAHAEREAEAHRVLEGLALNGAASFVASFGEIGDPAAVLAEAWDIDALEARYEEFLSSFSRVQATKPQTAFVALTRLVHEWRKFPFLDPGLPAELLPKRWSGARARELFHDRHATWARPANAWFDDRAEGVHPELTRRVLRGDSIPDERVQTTS
jgi:phenylacetic acid degradation operon negative regulatory protein